jgi:hypothetical protein
VEILERGIRENLSLREIDQEIGRGTGALKQKAKALMIWSSSSWTQEDSKTLLSLRSEGVSFQEIACRLGRSSYSVRKKHERLVKASHAGVRS